MLSISKVKTLVLILFLTYSMESFSSSVMFFTSTDGMPTWLKGIIALGLVSTALTMLFGDSPAVTAEKLGRIKSEALRKSFSELGLVRDISKNKIIDKVGQPTVESMQSDGTVLLVWNQPYYKVTLLFDNDICQGVVNEEIVNS